LSIPSTSSGVRKRSPPSNSRIGLCASAAGGGAATPAAAATGEESSGAGASEVSCRKATSTSGVATPAASTTPAACFACLCLPIHTPLRPAAAAITAATISSVGLTLPPWNASTSSGASTTITPAISSAHHSGFSMSSAARAR
jgi:hypothetical protein